MLTRIINKVKREVKRLARANSPLVRYHRSVARRPREDFTRGSNDWLIASEIHYGGFRTDVKRYKVSTYDPRSKEELAFGGMSGGDRMSAVHHGYGPKYAEHLAPFLERDPAALTIVEAGILEGTGLAIWADLFPMSNLIGLDIDLGHFRRNLPNLKARGAFEHGEPRVFEFDQFQVDLTVLAPILKGHKIDIMIDDGYHSDETIINTLDMTVPYLADWFVYFIEDNHSVAPRISTRFPQFGIDAGGALTVLTGNVAAIDETGTC